VNWLDKRPNVLILMSDEHSYRFMSFRERFGDGEPVRTPTLDGLAETGIYFDRAYTQMPLCTPARMCFMTGRSPSRCVALDNRSVLDPAFPTLPRHFASHGYATCLVGKMHFGGSLQYHGFQYRPYGDFGGSDPGHQPDPFSGERTAGMRGRTLDAGVTQIPEGMLQEQMVVRESLAFLREHEASRPDQPWLLCASFSRPHFPLTAPKRYFDRFWPEGVTRPKVERTGDAADHPMVRAVREGFLTDEVGDEEMMRARAGYFACVEYLDEVLGDFLACLERTGQLENTVIVYLTDHGEMAGEHGLWWKHTWHEASVRIPLIVHLPDHMRGEGVPSVRTDVALLIDVFPTLCALANIPIPEGLDGRDLGIDRGHGGDLSKAPGAAGEGPLLVSEALCNRWGEGNEFRIAVAGRYKYVGFRSAPELLFDLELDPLEQRNLAPDATGDAARALGTLREAVHGGFDWDEEIRTLYERANVLAEQYKKRSAASGPNQIQLPDGRLVEADDPLYRPRVVVNAVSEGFDDAPGGR